MWSSFTALQQHPCWGLHARPLEQEAADLLADRSLALLVSTLALIRVSGPDALTFLQGQTTCDFRDVAAGQVRLGAHCNPKGRMQASFRALPCQDDFLLLLPRDQAEPTRAALAKFALFSKVTLTLDDSLAVLALTGPEAGAWTRAIAGNDPDAGTARPWDSGLVATLEDGRRLLLVPAARCATTLATLQQLPAPLAGDNAWSLSEIRAGIAQIPPTQSEQWIPQELNYDLLRGVSFKKGCYKGQEIVARIHYRGQTKVRAFAVEITGKIATDFSIGTGQRLLTRAGENAGTLLNSAFVNQHTRHGMAALKVEASESEALQLEPNDGCAVRLLPLPYAITN